LFDELPEWHQDNEYIRRAYRPISGSVRVSIGSWMYVHNEFMNIWTHLIPLVVFLLGMWYIVQYLTSRYPGITGTDIFIFIFYLSTVCTCLAFSIMYHTLMNHSHEVEKLWLRMDLVGIMVLLFGLFVSAIYMVFWCEPRERIIYWSMVSQNSTHPIQVYLFRVRSIDFDLDWQIGVLGSFTIFIMVNPKYQVRKYRTFRALTFVTTGMSGYAPMIHGCIKFGAAQMMKQSGMPYYMAHGCLVLLGTLLYAVRPLVLHRHGGGYLTDRLTDYSCSTAQAPRESKSWEIRHSRVFASDLPHPGGHVHGDSPDRNTASLRLQSPQSEMPRLIYACRTLVLSSSAVSVRVGRHISAIYSALYRVGHEEDDIMKGNRDDA
jgi:adiponectin receptor